MRVASLSLDLDNEWCFMQTKGDLRWREFPSYLDLVVPRALEFFDRHQATITFFLVGQDAALPTNRSTLARIAAAGHEIGNHSFRHQPWLHEYASQELDQELERAEEAIIYATGQRPTGFRGPGYSYSADTLRALAARGYLYDASSFPNSVNWLARMYLFRRSGLDKAERNRRKALFGSASEVLAPLKPYLWDSGNTNLLEIPVTTLPVLRLPMHFSYVLYLGSIAPRLAISYFRMAVVLCRRSGVDPSLLFHPLDFMGRDDLREAVAFFPGMDMDSHRKLRLLDECIGILAENFEIVTMCAHATRALKRGDLKSRPLPV